MNRVSQLTNEQLMNELRNRFQADALVHIDEYKKLEGEFQVLSRQLREAEKEKSAFLSNVRNEINNPLASILGLAESITRLSREEKIKNLAALIHQQAFELDFQMRNVILASEIESGDIAPLIAQVNVTALLESQIDYLCLKINSSMVVVTLEADDALVFPTDSYLLQSIITNLIANAIEFTGKDLLVKVKAWMHESTLHLNVIDSGKGIPKEKQDLLFKRFKQLDSGTTKTHAGQGLGLSIVHALVDILDGTVELNSDVDSGTSITIRLPEPPDSSSAVVSAYGNEVIFDQGIAF